MDRMGAAKSAVLWTWWNGLAEGLWMLRRDVPVARIKYERLTDDPEAILRLLRDKLLPELEGRSIGVKGHVAELSIAHTVSGNPDRMRTGAVTIKPDERWRSGLDIGRQSIGSGNCRPGNAEVWLRSEARVNGSSANESPRLVRESAAGSLGSVVALAAGLLLDLTLGILLGAGSDTDALYAALRIPLGVAVFFPPTVIQVLVPAISRWLETTDARRTNAQTSATLLGTFILTGGLADGVHSLRRCADSCDRPGVEPVSPRSFRLILPGRRSSSSHRSPRRKFYLHFAMPTVVTGWHQPSRPSPG